MTGRYRFGIVLRNAVFRLLAIYLKVVLFRIGAAKVLPSAHIVAIPIRDNGELLVAVTSNEKLVLRPHSTASMMIARQSAVLRLYKAASSLPANLRLAVIDAYRSRAYQEFRWASRVAEIATLMPKASREEVEREAQKYTARPLGSGHQTGGAFDVTLVDSEGNEIDFGTKVKEVTQLTHTSAEGLSDDQRKYRHILNMAMCGAGFANYPLEWWHFSYGDRLWAAYTAQEYAVYGQIDSVG